jgi:DNA-binding LacI/PurR family transcriptional regulator
MALKRNDSSSGERPKRVTLQDIADAAGVQKMVVSGALNGTRYVAPDKRERVLQIAREMNYIPNFAARSLRMGRTGIIAVISGPLNEPYYSTIIHLLEKHICAAGFHTMLTRTPSEVREVAHATGNFAVDGAIVVDMVSLVNEFKSHSTIPCVSISTYQQAFVDNVVIDLGTAVDQAIDIMRTQGRRRIAYLVTTETMAQDIEVRARAYLKNMDRAGRMPEIIDVATDDLDAVEDNFKTYIRENGCPDALLCQNDEIAMCAFGALKDLGYAVPQDVLLVGCDGQRHMRYFTPPISTITLPMEEICAQAWQFLQQRLAVPDLPHQAATLEGTLVIRESLAPQSPQ